MFQDLWWSFIADCFQHVTKERAVKVLGILVRWCCVISVTRTGMTYNGLFHKAGVCKWSKVCYLCADSSVLTKPFCVHSLPRSQQLLLDLATVLPPPPKHPISVVLRIVLEVKVPAYKRPNVILLGDPRSFHFFNAKSCYGNPVRKHRGNTW